MKKIIAVSAVVVTCGIIGYFAPICEGWMSALSLAGIAAWCSIPLFINKHSF